MKLNDKTFLLYAAKYYDNPQCIHIEEFYDDLKRIQYIKRLFNKYKQDDDLRERLILNHLIVLYNCFGKSCTNMLFFRLKGYHDLLKPFIVLLNYMPEYVEYEDYSIKSTDIAMNPNVIQKLREI